VLFFQFFTDGALLRPLNLTNLVLQNSYIVVMADQPAGDEAQQRRRERVQAHLHHQHRGERANEARGRVLCLVGIVLFFQFFTDGALLRPLNLTNLVLQNS
jgi:ABC-type xylose transport system permease subunit